jgi:hypothetical protein
VVATYKVISQGSEWWVRGAASGIFMRPPDEASVYNAVAINARAGQASVNTAPDPSMTAFDEFESYYQSLGCLVGLTACTAGSNTAIDKM